MVASGEVMSPQAVRERFHTLEPMRRLSAAKRGWTLDLLTHLRTISREVFTLADAYSTEEALAKKHPENRHVRPKIRQQLQVLRDLGYLDFVERGLYRWRVKV
jgi:type II restriction enzyme